MEFLNIESGSSEWKELRRKYITGTDIAPLMLKKELRPSWMKSRVEVYLEKIGRLPDVPENSAMRRGRAMEHPTCERYANRMGFRVYTCKMIVDGIFAANIDRLVEMPDAPVISEDGKTIIAKRIVEAKTASKAWNENYPLYYYGQPQWYMGFIPECESADLICWFGDNVKNIKEDEPDEDFAIYPIERNQDFINQAREIATEFMEKYVIPQIFPEVESEADCRVKWALSKAEDSIKADKEILKALSEIRAIDSKIEDLNIQRSSQVMKVMKGMGEIPRLIDEYGNTLVTWKSSKARETVDWHALGDQKIADIKKWLEKEGILAAVPPELISISDEQKKKFTKTSEKGSRPFKVL